MSETMITPDELHRILLVLATELDLMPLSPSIRDRANLASKALHGAALAHDVADRMVGDIHDVLFTVTHRADLGSGPMRETARRIRGLVDVIVPAESPEADADESPVLTPDQAARYLGLFKLGVAKPADRIRYLVKTKKLRCIQVLGRTAFQRSDLDQYLIRHTARERKPHARTQHTPQPAIDQ